MLALGIVEIVDHLGVDCALRENCCRRSCVRCSVSPGITGLAPVTSLQSTDAGSGMTRLLRESGEITEKEKSIFAAFHFFRQHYELSDHRVRPVCIYQVPHYRAAGRDFHYENSEPI